MANTRSNAQNSSNSASDSSSAETGYGPRTHNCKMAGSSVNISHLSFTGKSEDYETWEDKMFAFLSEQGFDSVLDDQEAEETSDDIAKLNRRVGLQHNCASVRP